MALPSLSIAAFLLMVLATYAQIRIPRFTEGRGHVMVARGVLIATGLLLPAQLRGEPRWLIAFDLAAAVYLGGIWLMMLRSTVGGIKERAQIEAHRIGLLNSAVQPLKGRLGRPGFERLTQSLSLVFGTEAFVVLKDIWGLDRKRAEEVALWTCHALIQAAVAEDGKAMARVPGASGKRKNGMHTSVALLKKKTRIKVK
jgi:hypothetical protein